MSLSLENLEERIAALELANIPVHRREIVRESGRNRSQMVKHGVSVELEAVRWLVKFIPDASQAPFRAKYDILANGKRIEAKQSEFGSGRKQAWFFNIHRHGVVEESQVDFYILRLEAAPIFKAAIHLVLPAPIGRPTIVISLRSLLVRYGKYYNRVDLIDPTITIDDRTGLPQQLSTRRNQSILEETI